jgi:hypothetical protein
MRKHCRMQCLHMRIKVTPSGRADPPAERGRRRRARAAGARGTVAVAGWAAGDGSAAGAASVGPVDGETTMIAATDPLPTAASASTDADIAPLDLVSTGAGLGRAERPLGGFRRCLARED